MTEEYDDESNGFEPPEMSPPDPDAEDTRPIAKRRRRAPAPESAVKNADAAANAQPAPKGPGKSAADEDWGFDDDEEKSFIAEWKLGVCLVLVLIAGFGLVAWKKYDDIKQIAQEKLESFRGDETVVADGDDTDAALGDGSSPLSSVALAPPKSPRTDGITTADSSLSQPNSSQSKTGESMDALMASFEGGQSKPKNSDTTPVPPPADIGWGLSQKPKSTKSSPNEAKSAAGGNNANADVTFDFGPGGQSKPGLANNKPKTDSAAPIKPIPDPFDFGPIEPTNTPKLASTPSTAKADKRKPKTLGSAESNPFSFDSKQTPLPADNSLPAMDLAVEPIDANPDSIAATDRPASNKNPLLDPLDLDDPLFTNSSTEKTAQPKTTKPKTTADPFALDPINPSQANPKSMAGSPFDTPTPTSAKPKLASDPFSLEPLQPANTQPADTKTAVVPKPQPMQPLANDPFALDPVPTNRLPADPLPSNSLPAENPSIATKPTPSPVNDPFAFPADPVTNEPSFNVPANGRSNGPAMTGTPQPNRSRNNLAPTSPQPSSRGFDLPNLDDPLSLDNPLIGSQPSTPPMPQPSTLPTTQPRRQTPQPVLGPQRVDVAIDTRQYKVGDGESYWTISRKQYGTVRYFAALAEYNKKVVANPKYLRAGMKIELPPADVLEPLVGTATVPNVQPRTTRSMATLRPEAHTARRHTVQPGENYWSISKKQYGSSRYFAALAEWNKRAVPNPRTLRPGVVIDLPSASDLEPLVATASPDGPAPPRSTDTGANGMYRTADGEPRYRVGPNETLGSIAVKTLGRASRAVQIYEMNRDSLRSPNMVPVGTVLKLPRHGVLTATQTP